MLKGTRYNTHTHTHQEKLLPCPSRQRDHGALPVKDDLMTVALTSICGV